MTKDKSRKIRFKTINQERLKELGLFFVALALLILPFFWALKSNAAVSIRTNTGAITHWPVGSRFTLRTNELNRSGLTSDQVFSIFTTSLQRWKSAASNGFDFLYFQGTDLTRYPTTPQNQTDGLIFFTSQTSSSYQLQCGIIAVTQVYYDQNSGVINKAELRFNDNCYQFTNNPADTGINNRIYLGDVATHELGHALGLDHSESQQSSMVFSASIDMHKPSCDDHAMVRSIYDPSNGLLSRLAGNVQTPNGAPLFGAHIQAISMDRGASVGSTLSDKNGNYEIKGLEPGKYTILVEPYYPGSSTLSPYYSGIQKNICNGGTSAFDRTFAHSSGVLNEYTLHAGQEMNTGSLIVNCNAPSSINQNTENNINTAPTLIQNNLSDSIATMSTFQTSNHLYFLLKNQVGYLEANALSFTLDANPDVNVEFLNSNGTRPNQLSNLDRLITPESGYVDFDSIAKIDLATTQDIIVHVWRSNTVPNNRFPTQSIGLSSTPFVVLNISRGISENNRIYSNNSRCYSNDDFTAYPHLGDPGVATASGGGSTISKSKGCSFLGTIENHDKNNDSSEDKNIRFNNFFLISVLIIFARKFLRKDKINGDAPII